MSETEPMYSARFYRPREAWRDFWVETDDIPRFEYKPGVENSFVLVAQKLKALGKPDGDIQFKEVGAVRKGTDHGLIHYFESIDYLASRPVRQNVETETVTKARVSVIGQSVYNTLLGLRAGTSNGPELHPVTRAAIVKPGYVDADWKITPEGNEAILRYEADVAEKAVTKSVEKETKPKVVVSPKQAEAFQVVTGRPYAWGQVNGRTRNSMVESGWIVMTGDIPSLSDIGREVWQDVLRHSETK